MLSYGVSPVTPLCLAKDSKHTEAWAPLVNMQQTVPKKKTTFDPVWLPKRQMLVTDLGKSQIQILSKQLNTTIV